MALKAFVIFLFYSEELAGHASGVLLDGGPVITRDTQNSTPSTQSGHSERLTIGQ